MSSDVIDVGSIVAEIESDVARRRAAGDYPEALLRRLSIEFDPAAAEPPEVLATVGIPRPLMSARPVVGPLIVFVKRALRRSLAWYVQPIAEDQTRFNMALLRDVRRMERHLERLRTVWPPADDSLAARPAAQQVVRSRVDRLSHALGHTAGSAVLLAGTPAEVLDGIVGALPSVLFDRCDDPLDALDAAHPEAFGAVVLAGVLPRLSPRELLDAMPSAFRALRPGGALVLDAPSPSSGSSGPAVDLALRSPVPAQTATLLCEGAGFESLTLTEDGTTGWFTLSGRRPSL